MYKKSCTYNVLNTTGNSIKPTATVYIGSIILINYNLYILNPYNLL